jgi:hypothetical protein
MGKYLDIIRGRQGYERNEIDEISPPLLSSNSFVSYPSALADAFATLERRCPDAVPVARWREAVEDGRRFLGQWDEQAEALGWTAEDLFGLHPTAPLARYDSMGLVWLLRGKKVVALTATAATIRTATGGTLSFYRKAAQPLAPH